MPSQASLDKIRKFLSSAYYMESNITTPRRAEKTFPFITISRQTGAGGTHPRFFDNP